MRLFAISVGFNLCALLSGCAGYKAGLVLEPVGPPIIHSDLEGTNGTLVVYSAFDVHPNFTSTDNNRRRHTDYKIFAHDGRLLHVVHNDARTILESPIEVELPAGDYRISARANRFGPVAVPVIIFPHRTTTIHLEGGSTPDDPSMAQTNAVRLPDGQFVGWRAQSEEVRP